MLLDKRDEVRRGVACQSRLGEVGIGGEKILGPAMDIREIAAAPAGYQYLLAQLGCALDDSDPTSAFAGFDSAHESGGAGSENQNVKFLDHDRSHVKEAQPGQVVFFKQPLLYVLLVKLVDLRARHFSSVGGQIPICFEPDCDDLVLYRGLTSEAPQTVFPPARSNGAPDPPA